MTKCIVGASLVAATLATAAPALGQGEALFKTYCAHCHEGPSADAQAPGLGARRRLSAQQVPGAMERGTTRARAAGRSRAQRYDLAAYGAGKPLGPSAHSMPKSAFCSGTPAPPASPLAGPWWNGWG